MSNRVNQSYNPETNVTRKPNYLGRRIVVGTGLAVLALGTVKAGYTISENLGQTHEVGGVIETIGHNGNTDSTTDDAIKILEKAYDMQFSNDAVWNARNKASKVDPNPQPGDILNYVGTETSLGETEIDVVIIGQIDDTNNEHYDPSSHTIIIDSPNTH